MARWVIIAGSALAIGVVGCSKKKDADAEQTGVTGSEFREDSSAGSASSQASRILQPVYFDFDSFVVKEEFRGLIEAHAKLLGADRKKKLAIEGHADERGTREYNLALGERRAQAVERMVKVLGLTADRIKNVSYGEEKPVAMDHNEAAWALNRRVEIIY